MPKAERSLRVDAVVLRHMDWGEADRLLTIFTREHGKLRVIAKGVRKMKSRKAGHLEPFSHSTLMLAKGHDLWIVTDAETIDAFTRLRENLQLMTHAAYVIELVDRFTYEEGQNWQLYKLVVDTLTRLTETEDTFIPTRYYEMRLLDLLGFRPMLFECAACRKGIIAEDQFFSAEHGGALCPNCGARADCSRLISMDALRFLRHFQRSSYTESLKADPSKITRAEMEGLMNHYLTYLLERKLNTPEFLKQIQN
ncbi:MAG: DNA repair protein RecO [Chloroflexi bacterium]|nr:MAG: DNA repair protein RecO [Chloroflexota bacterium]MBA4374936.1 DNA repair protein RecO [Anaerolinea sp.]